MGYTLDEIVNDITKATPACFEPSIDYCVVKVPRFAFEKFQGTDDTLSTRMKAVGEVMAIGRTFEEALGKALRSLENGRAGLGADGKGAESTMQGAEFDDMVCTPDREPHLLHRPRRCAAAWSVEERPSSSTGIDPVVLRPHGRHGRRRGGAFAATSSRNWTKMTCACAKRFGLSDVQIAHLDRVGRAFRARPPQGARRRPCVQDGRHLRG